jgi:hypothetical protein
MKKFTAILALLILTCSFTIEITPVNAIFTEMQSLERDRQVSLTAKLVSDHVYFNLKMLNESETGFYSMVREFTNGEVESVDSRQMVANTIDTPLLYSFIEEELPENDVTYVLYRIASETTVVQKWNYSSADHKLSTVRLASSIALSE